MESTGSDSTDSKSASKKSTGKETPAARLRLVPPAAVPDNDFPQMHDAEVDIEIIGHVLDGFRGEVVILSDALRIALAERAAGRPPPG